MGTWGSGNFDSDTAADHLSELAGRLLDEVEAAMAGDPVGLEPDEYWGVAVPCNVELLCVLTELGYVGVTLPEPEKVTGWRETFLAVWDATIDGLDPKPDYRKDRRRVLADTFDRLAALAADQ